MKEQKKVASFSLTDEGYRALLALEKKTGKTRKELVSSAIIASLGNTMTQINKMVTFNLPDPNEIMAFRFEIVTLESDADRLITALFGLRPKDKKQGEQIAVLIKELQAHIEELRRIDEVLKSKQRLLKDLSVSDYETVPKLVRWFEAIKEKAAGKPDGRIRVAQAELTLKLLRTLA
jgi:hypothetical protein